MELIEAAGKRYATLEKRLKSIAWKQQLRARPELIHEVLSQEDLLEEALSRTRRRGELEGWPETLPALEPVREVLRRRARVEGLVRKRLEELSASTEAPSLKKDLAHLEKLVREVVSMKLGPGETQLLGTKNNQAMPRPLAVLLFMLLPLVYATGLFSRPSVMLGMVGLGFTLLVVFLLRAGEFWLTSDRLIWKPLVGDTVSVSLSSIRDGGIHMEGAAQSLRVQGDRAVHVRYTDPLEQLAVLLELHRQPPLLGSSRGGVRMADVSFYPARLQEGPGKPARSGWAVLRPQGVSFLPLQAGARLLESITGKPPPEGVKVEVSWVLDGLSWLPESEFDAHLARAVEFTGGVHWPAWESRRKVGLPAWKEIHITHGPQFLKGKVDWSQQDAVERVFGSWPMSS
jgi:hypothetical protein